MENNSQANRTGHEQNSHSDQDHHSNHSDDHQNDNTGHNRKNSHSESGHHDLGGHQDEHSGHTQQNNQGHDDHDHEGHHAYMIKDFKKRFWISLVLTVPVMVLAPLIQDFLGYSLTFPGDQHIQFGLSTIIYFYGGWPFLKGIYEELKERSPRMISLSTVVVAINAQLLKRKLN